MIWLEVLASATVCFVASWISYGRGYRKGHWGRRDEAAQFDPGDKVTFGDGSFIVVSSQAAPPKEEP